MTNNISSKNQKIIFSENTSSIIAELLKKYGFKETPKDVSEKIQKGQEPIGTTIAKTTKEVAEGKFQINELPSLLQKRLNLSVIKAKKLASDIKKEILDLVGKTEEVFPSTTRNFEKEKSYPSKKDIYREPIE